MPTLVTFNGINYNIPLPGEVGWGDQVNAFLVAVAANALVSGSNPAELTIDAATIKVDTLDESTIVVGAGDTIDPTRSNIVISALSAISLDPTTAIADGDNDGQILILTGAGSFPIQIQDGSNTKQNGDIFINAGESIEYKWDTALKWVEQRRSN